MKKSDPIVRETPPVVSDGGKVRIGDYTPLFPAPRPTEKDSGK
jgi:hypothetical protein